MILSSKQHNDGKLQAAEFIRQIDFFTAVGWLPVKLRKQKLFAANRKNRQQKGAFTASIFEL